MSGNPFGTGPEARLAQQLDSTRDWTEATSDCARCGEYLADETEALCEKCLQIVEARECDGEIDPEVDPEYCRVCAAKIDADTMPMLPNDYHPGPRCSCAACLKMSAECERDTQNALRMASVWDSVFWRLVRR